MTQYIVSGQQMTDIADAIRGKLNEQDTYTISEMPTKISGIQGVPTCTLTITNNSEYPASVSSNNIGVGNQCAIFDENVNAVKSIYAFDSIYLLPSESTSLKLFYLPYSPNDIIKGGETPSSYLDIRKFSTTESYTGLYDNLNNISIYVEEADGIKGNSYYLVPYPINSSLDSSFTIYVSGGK